MYRYIRSRDLGRIEGGDENEEYNSHSQPYIVNRKKSLFTFSYFLTVFQKYLLNFKYFIKILFFF